MTVTVGLDVLENQAKHALEAHKELTKRFNFSAPTMNGWVRCASGLDPEVLTELGKEELRARRAPRVAPTGAGLQGAKRTQGIVREASLAHFRREERRRLCQGVCG